MRFRGKFYGWWLFDFVVPFASGVERFGDFAVGTEGFIASHICFCLGKVKQMFVVVSVPERNQIRWWL